MRKTLILAVVGVLSGVVATSAPAAPIGVRVEDHDFTIDVPFSALYYAEYNYNGTAADTITLTSDAPNHYVPSYSYEGDLPTVVGPPAGPAASSDPYPVGHTASGQWGGDLDLELSFSTSDGPYTGTGDAFDISLNGTSGHLKIVGEIYNQAIGGGALYPGSGDVTLLDITFDTTSLLARVNKDRIFKVEAAGTLNTLLGETPPQGLDRAVVMFDFAAEPAGTAVFTDPAYTPTDDVSGSVEGGIGGHTGVPEPATLALLGAGLAGAVLARRRRRR